MHRSTYLYVTPCMYKTLSNQFSKQMAHQTSDIVLYFEGMPQTSLTAALPIQLKQQSLIID